MDSNNLHGLLETALVGTQRQSLAAPILTNDIGLLLEQIAASGAPAARQLLQMVGALAMCSRTGFQAAPTTSPAWTPASLDTSTVPDGPMIEMVLRPLLLDGPQRLQILALRRLAACGLRLPPALLPVALEMGRRSMAVRPALSQVLGARGHWLAMHNSSWGFAAGVADQASTQEQWEHGNPEQRLAAFAEMRKTDAAAARDTLAGELKTLSAAERNALLPLLAVNLSASDEALLDNVLLKDRSTDVRMAAANLLARLPQSRHALAITTALAPLVTIEQGILGKKCAIEAPAEADPAWKSEALELTRPQHEPLGERAWWLYQLMRNCPLDWWQQHTGLAPAELINATAKSEWQESLVRGWRDAVVATQHVAWAEVLLQNTKLLALLPSTSSSYWPKSVDVSMLVAVLPLAQQEHYWAENIPSEKYRLGGFLKHILLGCPADHRLSPHLSQRLAQAIANELNSTEGIHFTLQYALPDMLCVLDEPALALVGAAPTLDESSPLHTEGSVRLARIATARRMLAALPMKPKA